MSNKDYGEFIVKVISTLKRNGFPDNQVSLPLEKLYESAYGKGLNLNKVLEFIKEKEGINHQKTDSKIIFSPAAISKSDDAPESAASEPKFDLEKIKEILNTMPKTGPLAGMMAKAEQMLGNMTPDQMQDMGKMFAGLSDEKKEEILKKGKDMGLF